MAIETSVTSKGIYFITFTCHNWLPLIDTADAYADVYKFFEVIKKDGNAIVGYVIMSNHLHFKRGMVLTKFAVLKAAGGLLFLYKILTYPKFKDLLNW